MKPLITKNLDGNQLAGGHQSFGCQSNLPMKPLIAKNLDGNQLAGGHQSFGCQSVL